MTSPYPFEVYFTPTPVRCDADVFDGQGIATFTTMKDAEFFCSALDKEYGFGDSLYVVNYTQLPNITTHSCFGKED